MFSSYRSPGATVAGRRSQPTAKVKQLLIDSVGKEMRQCSQKLSQYEVKLRDLIRDDAPVRTVRRSYESWLELLEEFCQVEVELTRYLSPDELDIHKRIIHAKRQSFHDFKIYVDGCLSTAAMVTNSVVFPGSVASETLRLEEEIKKINSQLDMATASLQNLSSRTSSADVTSDEDTVFAGLGVPDGHSTPRHTFTPPHGNIKLDSSPMVFNTTPLRPDVDRLIVSPPRPKVAFTHPLEQVSVAEPVVLAVTANTARDDGTSALMKLAELLERKRDRLPQLEPETFSGDLLQYPLWKQSFETLIEKNTDLVTDRLFFLGKYTAGPARECIAGFLSLFSEDAYKRAKATLNSRYGDKIRVAEAYRRKLFAWPVVKKGDPVGLQKIADFLWQCHAAMESVGHLSSLNSAEEIYKLMRLLPSYISDRWDRVVDRYYYQSDTDPLSFDVEGEGQYPPFLELCKFVSREARVANGPGRAMSKDAEAAAEKPGSTWTKPSKRAHVHLTSAQGEEAPPKKPPVCYYCSKAHVVSRCDAFLSLDRETKQQYAKANGMCFGCLSKRHSYRDCRSKRPELMKDPAGKTATTLKTQATQGAAADKVYSLIIPVTIHSKDDPTKVVKTLCMLDTQSDTCFMSDSLAESLRLQLPEVDLHLTTMGSSGYVKSQLSRSLMVCGSDDEPPIELKKCYSRPSIPFNADCVPLRDELSRVPHLKKIAGFFPTNEEELSVDLLIGFNCPAAFVTTDYLYVGDQAPFGVHTGVGWGVMGSVGDVNLSSSLCLSTSAKELSMERVLRAFDLDLQSDAEVAAKVSQEDVSFLQQMQDSVVHRPDGHYEVDLPFKEPFPEMPNNRSVAVRRMQCLAKKMNADPEYARQYRSFMEDLISAGHVERATEPPEPGKVSYGPHHGVVHPRKPGKIRVVNNFSAEKDGISLNKKLLSGPDLTNNLVGVLCRFREERVAFMCDIKGMFLQVYVTEHHRDYLRFLWFEEGDQNGKIVDYRFKVHPFGATSAPSCANYVLKTTADDHVDQCGEEAARFVKRGFYVDDGLGSKPTVEQVVELFLKAHEVCGLGGFFLHKFTCNDPNALKMVPEELLAKNLQDWEFSGPDLPVESSLGLLWAMATDSFMFVVRAIVTQLTRRGFLSALSSIYDPVGFLSPVVLVGRIILQQLCIQSAAWDEPVPAEYLERWTTWYEELTVLSELRIPRCYRVNTRGDLVSIQMHHFCDASTLGYGACSYVRLEDADGRVDVRLVAAKSRVAPKKVVTIPRLELQSAVLAVKQALFLKDEMPYEEMTHVYWTDSKVSLGYIQNSSRRFHLFVSNRVQFIREHTAAEQWNHVAGLDNPADLASRGCPATELVNSGLWWRGPEFLLTYSTQESVEFPVADDDPEVKQPKAVVLSTTATTVNSTEALHKFSDWRRVTRVVAIWRMYLKKLHARVSIRPARPLKKNMVKVLISVADEQDAERVVVRWLQREHFEYEHDLLKKLPGRSDVDDVGEVRQRTLKKSSTAYKLDLYLDPEGMLRVGGRIDRAGLPESLTHPLLLPKNNHLTELLIASIHRRIGHGGRQATLAAVRSDGYWPVHGRSTVEKCTRGCFICRRLRGTSVVQKMSELPAERLNESAPFTYCGVDLCGPLIIRERRCDRKRWICVYVCFTSKAVHLEVLNELSTNSFINSFRRFTGRRGAIRSLHCDRGTNFVGAANEFDAALLELDQDAIHSQLLQSGCDWTSFNFNPPKASHMGGIWERMIRSFRVTFAALVARHGQQISEEILATLVVEAEGLMNSRPLSTLDLCDPSADPPLTPARLLTMKTATALPPPGKFMPEDLYSQRRWRTTQYLAGLFWQQWRKEVLPALQAREKWQKATPSLKKDDVVIMMDEQLPRAKWPLAIVEEVFPSKDGLVRKVRVRTSGSSYDRPVCKLVFMCSSDL